MAGMGFILTCIAIIIINCRQVQTCGLYLYVCMVWIQELSLLRKPVDYFLSCILLACNFNLALPIGVIPGEESL